MSESKIFPAHPRYRLYTALGAVVAALLGWDLARQWSPEYLFFFVVALGFVLLNLRWMLARVELTPTGLTLHEFWTSKHVDFRQLVDIFEGERRSRALAVVYYPIAGNGLIDLDRPRSLFLPALDRQEELATILRQAMPA